MPTVANGIEIDWHLARRGPRTSSSSCARQRALAVRLLGYVNHANMGNYDEAIAAFLAGRDAHPDIAAHRAPGRVKTGIGVNLEYALPSARADLRPRRLE